MKDRRKTIRISKEDEQKLLDSLKDTGMNFSDYVRKAISDHPIIVVSGIQDLHLQVARVGNNLNQLVTLAHEGRITSVDLTECFEMLQMTYTSVDLGGRRIIKKKTYSKLSEISEVINHGDCDSGPG